MADRQFTVKSTSIQTRLSITKTILQNMSQRSVQSNQSLIMLAGDPGVGKTSYVKALSRLLGMELIVIEAPHITEEHLINIPFIVYNPSVGLNPNGNGNTESAGMVGEKHFTEKIKSTNDYQLKVADSALFTAMQKAKRLEISDADYLAYLKDATKTSKSVRLLFEALGGDLEKGIIPPKILKARANFKVLFFLDEYFRTSNERIRNILRNILNNKIANHEMPNFVYPIYASNMADEGVDNSNIKNQQIFNTITMDSPPVDEWFTYVVERAEKDFNIKLNKEVVDEFYTVLTNEDGSESDDVKLSKNDVSNDVRSSPRRWEQILLFVNAALTNGSLTEEKAKTLYSNVATSFKNHITGNKSEFADKVLKMILRLIKTVGGIELHPEEAELDDSNWEKLFEQQVVMKMKLGEARAYIPILSGPPGIAKTAIVKHVAKDLGLHLIHVDCSVINADDLTGLPLAEKGNDDNTTVKFSEPPLYQTIIKSYKSFKHTEGKYSTILFFDELNRASTAVFNGIRKVLLEKSFGGSGSENNSEGFMLPKDMIIVAAINPVDGGTNKLTNHIKDVADIISSTSSWPKVIEYINSDSHMKEVKAVIGGNQNVLNNFVDSAKQVILYIKNKWSYENSRLKNNKFKHPANQAPFYLDLSQRGDQYYFSQRNYTHLFDNVINSLDMLYDEYKVKVQNGEYNVSKEEDKQKLEEIFRGEVYTHAIKGLLTNALHTNSITKTTDVEDRLQNFEKQFYSAPFNTKNMDDSLGLSSALSTIVLTTNKNITDILTMHLNAPQSSKFDDDGEFIDYMKHTKDDVSIIAAKIEDWVDEQTKKGALLGKMFGFTKMVQESVDFKIKSRIIDELLLEDVSENDDYFKNDGSGDENGSWKSVPASVKLYPMPLIATSSIKDEDGNLFTAKDADLEHPGKHWGVTAIEYVLYDLMNFCATSKKQKYSQILFDRIDQILKTKIYQVLKDKYGVSTAGARRAMLYGAVLHTTGKRKDCQHIKGFVSQLKEVD